MKYIIKNNLDDYRLVFKNKYVLYQQIEKKAPLQKKLKVYRQFKILYKNVKYIEYEKFACEDGSNGVAVTIQLHNLQPEFITTTVMWDFFGDWTSNELDVSFEQVNKKLNKKRK